MTTKNNPLVSIIVPTQSISCENCQDLIKSLSQQSYSNFELIIIPDNDIQLNVPSYVFIYTYKDKPAAKRDFGVSKSHGSIIAFIDSDAVPADKHWLNNAVNSLKPQEIAAVCGPGLTPAGNTCRQQVSGYVWSSWIGAGGAGVYRNKPQPKRYVDDYPSFNLFIKKSVFLEVGGFNTHYWPGEDTILCHEVVHRLHKKILYSPDIAVFHHRRSVFICHLQQVARYGLHRGYFSKILPKTSRRLGYYVPSCLLIYIVGLLLTSKLLLLPFYIFMPLYIYTVLVVITAGMVLSQSKNVRIAAMFIPALFLTHVVYGYMFLKGVFSGKIE